MDKIKIITPDKPDKDPHARQKAWKKRNPDKVRAYHRQMKTETKYTPGPWELDETDCPIIVNGPLDGESETICTVSNNTDRAYFYSIETSTANARLIAAAPDMLEALKDIAHGMFTEIEFENKYAKCQDIAREAIAKAEPKPSPELETYEPVIP